MAEDRVSIPGDISSVLPEGFLPGIDLCGRLLQDLNAMQETTPAFGPMTDAFTKVRLALSTLQDVLVVCHDQAEKAHPYLRSAPVQEPATEPQPMSHDTEQESAL